MLRIKSPGNRKAPGITARSAEELTAGANEFIQKNDLVAAYPLLNRLAGLRSNDCRSSVMAGVVAVKLEKESEAVDHFNRALTLAPDDYDANYNLALVQMMKGELSEALARLRHLVRLYPNNSSLWNDMAVLWANQKRTARALGAYSRALRVDPNDSRTRNIAMQFCLEEGLLEPGRKLLGRQQNSDSLTAQSVAEIHRWQEILDQSGTVIETEPTEAILKPKIANFKIAFFANHRAFINDIIESLATDNEVRLFEGDSLDQISELMDWADIAWFEWCDNLIIEATSLPKKCKIICRLHSYEAFTDMPSKVDWSRVDHLLFVNQSVADLCRPQIKAPIPVTVIHNGVDLEKYKIPQHSLTAGAIPSKKIASVGYINYKKNPSLLLYCFKKIHQYDPEYSLHIAGSHQDPRIQLYIDNFLKHNPLPVHFDGWVEDMPSWYADKGFVISTSLFESFHYSIAEGMASGLLPLIHHWYGADYLYPSEYLFEDPDECLQLVKRFEAGDRREIINKNRDFIAQKYNQADKLNEITSLLAGLASDIATVG